MKILNLYAGVGGNRKLWTDCEVTAVESNSDIAEIYGSLYPNDNVVIDDAHEYLRLNIDHFDFIWSSPPCQSHSKMMKATRHHHLRRYPDLRLYEEIIYLSSFFKGLWVVENVKPYYTPLITPRFSVGRHNFWTNFDAEVKDVPRPKGFMNTTNMEGRAILQDWLGIHFDKVVYYDGNHCPAQILRNCVHPKIGEQIFSSAKNLIEVSQIN